MNKFILFLASLFLVVAASCTDDEKVKMPWEDDLNHKEDTDSGEITEAEVGKPLPRWSEGYLDIHSINSARGECTFYILPDGTTLLVDAGEIPEDASATGGESHVPCKPNAATRPHTVYAKYIRHFMPAGSSSIDWCHASHFHIDHIGDPTTVSGTGPNGYKLTGLTALYQEVPFDRLIDRAYPDYNGEDAAIPPIDGGLVQSGDWKKFVDWAVQNKNLDARRFRVGEEQITLLKNADAYSNFSIFNIVGNGTAYILKDGQPFIETGITSTAGNPASCGFHLRYGSFDYLACGDLASAPQNRVANYYRDFMVKGGLEAFKAHHHLSSNAWGSGMQNNEFDPRVIINQCFYKKQPDIPLLTSIISGAFDNHTYTWDKDIFSTNVHPEALAENAELYKGVAGYNGHVVLRVSPGGNEFHVYMLDDTDYDYKVTSIHGPYTSK